VGGPKIQAPSFPAKGGCLRVKLRFQKGVLSVQLLFPELDSKPRSLE
jgi:hypothetical protein